MDVGAAFQAIEVFDRTVSDARGRQAMRREHEAPSFNVFELTRRSNFEVTTHSAFLAALLDPFGSHRQGSLFLAAFLHWLRLKRPGLIVPDAGPEWSVKTEVAFAIPGAKADGQSIGVGDVADITGQIDLVLDAGDRATLVIENKVWAGDQAAQLARYRDWLKEQPAAQGSESRTALIYLTVSGSEASEVSLKGLSPGERSQIVLMSYRRDVASILRLSLDQINAPIVGETVKQYLMTIAGEGKVMTDYEQAVRAFFSDPSRVQTCLTMREAFEECKRLLQRELVAQVLGTEGPGDEWGLVECPHNPDRGYEGGGFTLNERFGVLSGKLWVGYAWQTSKRLEKPWLAAVSIDRPNGEEWRQSFMRAMRDRLPGAGNPNDGWPCHALWNGWPHFGPYDVVAKLDARELKELAPKMALDLKRFLEAIEEFARTYKS